MVLWELTLATAYVLGLKRTYRLALRTQRRVLRDKYPQIRDFTERRTRSVFSMALHVHQEIQRRDISVGRSLGNWMLRMLDRARPQANIRGPRANCPGAPSDTSQTGPGRPSPRRLENGSSKDGQTKPMQAVQLKNSGDSNVSTFTTYTGRHPESTLRSRITNELKLRTRPLLGPLPTLSRFRLWWQPVRRASGGFSSRANSPAPLSVLARDKALSLHVLQAGSTRALQSVFRADIAQWMRAQ